MAKIKKTNIYENDCEKVKSLADEYLHDWLLVYGESEIPREAELSEDDKFFIENHLGECKDCFDFIETESKYLEEIRTAEYIPEISISKSVMDKIIEGRIITDKPKKRRFVPVGFISAAAVILIVFIASKGGMLSIFMKASHNESGIAETDYAYQNQNDIIIFGDSVIMESPDNIRKKAAGIAAEGQEAEGDADGEFGLFAAYDAGAPEVYAAESAGEDMMTLYPDDNINATMAPRIETADEESPAPVAADAPADAPYTIEAIEANEDSFALTPAPVPAATAPEPARSENPTKDKSDNNALPYIEIPFEYTAPLESMTALTGMVLSDFAAIYFIDSNYAVLIRTKILQDIEVYINAEENTEIKFYIIENKYEDIFAGNLAGNAVNDYYVGFLYPNGEYIAVIYN